MASLQSVLSGTTDALMWTTVLLFGYFAAAWVLFGTSVLPSGVGRRTA